MSKTEGAVDSMGQDMEDAADEAGNEIEEAGQDVENAADNAGNEMEEEVDGSDDMNGDDDL